MINSADVSMRNKTMDITTHNRLLNTTSLRLAMGLEIECLGYERNDMANNLRNSRYFEILQFIVL